jgi:hypothetical protein
MFGSIYRKLVNKNIEANTSLTDIENNVMAVRKLKSLPLSKSKTNLVHGRGNIFSYSSSNLDKANKALDKFISI